MPAQSFANFTGNQNGNLNEPTEVLASDGFVGSPTFPFNPNSPTFGPANFPAGMGLQGTGAPAPTIASAATIAPTTPIVFVSGTAVIATITPPGVFATAGGEIVLIPTGAWTTTTTGNIALASTAVVGKALTMVYDSGAAKWFPSY